MFIEFVRYPYPRIYVPMNVYLSNHLSCIVMQKAVTLEMISKRNSEMLTINQQIRMIQQYKNETFQILTIYSNMQSAYIFVLHISVDISNTVPILDGSSNKNLVVHVFKELVGRFTLNQFLYSNRSDTLFVISNWFHFHRMPFLAVLSFSIEIHLCWNYSVKRCFVPIFSYNNLNIHKYFYPQIAKYFPYALLFSNFKYFLHRVRKNVYKIWYFVAYLYFTQNIITLIKIITQYGYLIRCSITMLFGVDAFRRKY